MAPRRVCKQPRPPARSGTSSSPSKPVRCGGRYRRFASAHLNDPAANGLAAAISLLGGGPPVTSSPP